MMIRPTTAMQRKRIAPWCRLDLLACRRDRPALWRLAHAGDHPPSMMRRAPASSRHDGAYSPNEPDVGSAKRLLNYPLHLAALLAHQCLRVRVSERNSCLRLGRTEACLDQPDANDPASHIASFHVVLRPVTLDLARIGDESTRRSRPAEDRHTASSNPPPGPLHRHVRATGIPTATPQLQKPVRRPVANFRHNHASVLSCSLCAQPGHHQFSFALPVRDNPLVKNVHRLSSSTAPPAWDHPKRESRSVSPGHVAPLAPVWGIQVPRVQLDPARACTRGFRPINIACRKKKARNNKSIERSVHPRIVSINGGLPPSCRSEPQ